MKTLALKFNTMDNIIVNVEEVQEILTINIEENSEIIIINISDVVITEGESIISIASLPDLP